MSHHCNLPAFFSSSKPPLTEVLAVTFHLVSLLLLLLPYSLLFTHTETRVILSKYKLNCVTLLLKTLWWLPNILTVTYEALHNLSTLPFLLKLHLLLFPSSILLQTYWPSCLNMSFLFTPRNFCTCCSLCLEWSFTKYLHYVLLYLLQISSHMLPSLC